MATHKRSLDLSGIPRGFLRRYPRCVCLSCIFHIFTKQLGLGPRTAYSQVKGYAPTVAELTGATLTRPFFLGDTLQCPYCGATKRSHAPIDTWRIEGNKATDAARRDLIKSLPKTGGLFQILESKANGTVVFCEWLEEMGSSYDLDAEDWMMAAGQHYLERREPKNDWEEVFRGTTRVRPSSRVDEGWESEGGRLFLSPVLYNEILIVQYLISRSHKAGGRTFQGRLTLGELARRLRNVGYLQAIGETARDPDLLEKLIEHLTGGAQPVKLYHIVDRRALMDKLKSVYARYG